MNKRIVLHALISFLILIGLTFKASQAEGLQDWFIVISLLLTEVLVVVFLMTSLLKTPKAIIGSWKVVLVSFFTTLNPMWIIIFIPLEIDALNVSHIIGSAILVIGYLMYFVTILTIRNVNTILPEANKLITKGIYKVTRHPLYLSYVLMMSSLALITSSKIVIVISIIYIIGLVYRAKKEEKVLKKKVPVYYIYIKTTGWFGYKMFK